MYILQKVHLSIFQLPGFDGQNGDMFSGTQGPLPLPHPFSDPGFGSPCTGSFNSLPSFSGDPAPGPPPPPPPSDSQSANPFLRDKKALAGFQEGAGIDRKAGYSSLVTAGQQALPVRDLPPTDELNSFMSEVEQTV